MKRLDIGQAEHQSLAHITGQLEFFAPFKGADLDRLLSHIELYSFANGEKIFTKGDSPTALYIIHQGEVVICLNPWFSLFRKVARLHPGNLFGEMALLENRPRKATAIAKQSTQLFVLLRWDFDELLQRNPIFAEGVRFIAERRRFEDSR